MPRPVKTNPDLRAARTSRTEAAIMDAAHELFVRLGYVPTTLADVAERAGVAARTVYVRFGSKVTLFRRVLDRALVGDDEPVAVAGRPRAQQALSAPTLDDRLEALVDVTVGIYQRAGALFEVASQAEALEPELAAAWTAGRKATARLASTFWRRAAADGLLPDGVDAKQMAVTTDVLICADTMVHLHRTRAWNARDHRRWLRTTLRHLTTSPAP